MNQERDYMATEAEACKEYARNYGYDHPELAWILTPFDTWEPNPAYRGPKVPHPEDEPDEYKHDDFSAAPNGEPDDCPF